MCPNGLYKYYQLTGSKEVKKAINRISKYGINNVPPLNHKWILTATIYRVVLGYEAKWK